MNKIVFILAMLFCPSVFAATLTANYFPYACLGGSTPQLCNSNIITTSSNIGIGTSSPSQTLDVNGNILIESTDQLILGGPTSGVKMLSGGTDLRLYWNGAEMIYGDPNGDIYSNNWANYSASSTIVGFSSVNAIAIYTKKVGKTVFVTYALDGTSNSTSLTFTLPYPSASTGQAIWVLTGLSANNGALLSSPSVVTLPTNSSIVTCYKDTSLDLWTSTNRKYVYGQFEYQSS